MDIKDSKAAPFEKGETQHVDHAFLDDGVVVDTSEGGDYIYIPGSIAEKKLVRKIDAHLIPMLWVMYILNYIDRSNIGNAKTGGMEKALHLSSSDYSLCLSVFFIGYLLNEVPSNLILTRSRPSIFLPTIMMVWGCMSIAVKGVHNLAGITVFRFFLGLVEAGFFPGVILAFGGLFAGVITSYMDGIGHTQGWQWLFMIEGMMTMVGAAIAYFVLPDFPANTKWLTPEEKHMAILRVYEVSDQEERVSHSGAFFAACKDWKTWAFALTYSLINASGTISYFFPTLMTTLGYAGRTAQFMTIPIYIVALVISVTTSFFADHFRDKAYFTSGAALLGGVMFLCCAILKNNTTRYVLICFGAGGLWSAIPLMLGYVATNFKGREKRAVSIAIVNGIGNLSSIYGSFIWPSEDGPQYKIGFACTTCFIWTAAICCFVIRRILGNPNAEVDAADESHRQNALDKQAKLGLTDV